MTEFQKIAIGLLGMTHPEIFRSRTRSSEEVAAARQSPNLARVDAWMRAVKFAFAALIAGSRAVPLGDNGKITRELCAYGTSLRCES
jgi:hypothetical protein